MRAVVVLVLLGAASAAVQNEKIIGGHECPKHSIPYHASLNSGFHFCSGSLISSQWVVSAAHCYKPRIQVVLGIHNFTVNEGTEQWIEGAKIIKHPQYNSYNLENDIMLIKLSSPATLNNYVKPVSLPSRCPVVGENCMVSGWGNMVNSGLLFPETLRCLKHPIMDDRICKDSAPDLFTEDMVCSGFSEGGSGICQGDSGGPLVCGEELQGVATWGYECTKPGQPSVYTRVCHYSSWIRSVMSSS